MDLRAELVLMGSAVTQIALALVAVVGLKANTFEVGLLTAAATTAASRSCPLAAVTSTTSTRNFDNVKLFTQTSY